MYAVGNITLEPAIFRLYYTHVTSVGEVAYTSRRLQLKLALVLRNCEIVDLFMQIRILVAYELDVGTSESQAPLDRLLESGGDFYAYLSRPLQFLYYRHFLLYHDFNPFHISVSLLRYSAFNV